MRRLGLALAGSALLGLVGLGCDVEQRVVRIRPPATAEQAKLPPAPTLERTSEVIRYPDGAYSVDGLLRESAKLVDKEVRVKGFVRSVQICDPEADATCTKPPHAFIVDDLKRPRRALLVVGTLQSGLPKLVKGQGETLKGRFSQVSPDGRFVRAGGLMVLPDLAPPPAPAPAPAATPAEGEKPAAGGDSK